MKLKVKVERLKIKRGEIRGTDGTAEWVVVWGVQGGNVGRSVRARSASVRLGVGVKTW